MCAARSPVAPPTHHTAQHARATASRRSGPRTAAAARHRWRVAPRWGMCGREWPRLRPAPRAALTAASRHQLHTPPRCPRALGLRGAPHGDGALPASATRHKCSTHECELRGDARALAMRRRCDCEVLGRAGGCGGGTCPRLQRTTPSLLLGSVQHGRLPTAWAARTSGRGEAAHPSVHCKWAARRARPGRRLVEAAGGAGLGVGRG